ncbi:MAG: alpha-glucosidase/alpha-galactosidase [Chloroflexota bacterium]|nr:alpha-glucosidase/alpha-galactosidase [Chloroflexota bacterium]
MAMGKSLKITVIGAGSATFSLGLVKDLCLTEHLKGSLVSFMDIDAERLENITALAERYSRELGADLRFERTTDRQQALTEADFVINTADAKGHYHARAVRELTARHGYYYGAAGIGGFYNFELMLAVARDMETVCPEAWLIQSGNPVFDGTTLMTRQTKTKVIGLCHGHYGYLHICQVLGLEPAKVKWQAPGVNHAIWLTHFLYEGQSAYPILDRWIAEQGAEYWETHVAERTHDIQMSRGTIRMYQTYGLMPIGDTPRQAAWWTNTDIETKKRWFGEPWGGPDTELARPVHVQGLETKLAQIAATLKDEDARVADVFGRTRTREQQVPIIDALANGEGDMFQVNVPNRGGALEGIDEDVAVEVQAYIDQTGVHPLRMTPLPQKILLGQIEPKVNAMERGLLAYLSGDKQLLLHNILDNHQTRSYEQAVAVLDDLLAMPGHEEAAAHFGARKK